jgi:hypothetical protein
LVISPSATLRVNNWSLVISQWSVASGKIKN